MNFPESRTGNPESQGINTAVPKEAEEMYREISASGVFNISRQQFMAYWLQSRCSMPGPDDEPKVDVRANLPD